MVVQGMSEFSNEVIKMDLEQIIKRLEWLDEERRKDKTLIVTLQERLESFEVNAVGMAQQLKELDEHVTRIMTGMSRFDQIEDVVAQQNVALSRKIDDVEKQRMESDREKEKVRLADLESLMKSIGENRNTLESLQEIKRDLRARIDEEYRLTRLIDEYEEKFMNIERSHEEFHRAQKMLEDGRRQDNKRLLDLQGEASGLRKRADEHRGRLELMTENMRKLEMRIGELHNAETERRQDQNAFVEKQNLTQVERDRTWKEWQERFELFSTQTVDMDAQLRALDATHRAVKRSQEGFEEITQRFERRINEITEMQRLMEERFRQEWVTSRGDDQKRWTNFTLTQEELQRETDRQFGKHGDRLVQLEDYSQESHDVIVLLTTDLQHQMQSTLQIAREWLDNYDRTYGRFK